MKKLNFRPNLPFTMGFPVSFCKIGLYEVIFHPDIEEGHTNTFCFIKKKISRKN